MKILTIIALLLPFISLEQTRKYEFDFTIIFGDCFHGENATLKIQGMNVVDSKKLESSTAGKTKLQVTQTSSHLLVKCAGNTAKLARVNISTPLKVEIFFLNKWYKYTFNLKSGIFFLVNYCTDDTSKRNTLTVEQTKEPPIFL